MIEAGTMPRFSWPFRVTKHRWRTVLITAAGVAFSAAAGVEPAVRNLITFAKAGTLHRQAFVQRRADGWDGSRSDAQ